MKAAQVSEPRKSEVKKMSIEDYASIMLTKRLTPFSMDFLPRYYVQNDFMRRVIMVRNFPSSIEVQCALSKLSNLPGTTFSLRCEPLNETTAHRLIDNQVNNKLAKGRNSNKYTAQKDAEFEQENIQSFYRQLQEGKNKIYYTNIFVEFYAKTEKELNEKQNKITTILGGYKITYDVLRRHQIEGFVGVSPIGKDLFIKSANNIPSRSIAKLYPFSFSNKNDARGLWLGETVNGGYVFLDFFQRNNEITNGNFTIFGIPGQGKTWLQKKIISQMIFAGETVFILDPDKDYIEMVRRLGGTVINAASGRVKINPFEVRRIMTDEDVEKEIYEEDPSAYEDTVEAFKQKDIFYQHLSWLKDFFVVLYPDADFKTIDALMWLTQDMYIENNINKDTNFDELVSHDYPTFTTLYRFIDRCYKNNDHEHITEDIYHNLLLMLRDAYDGSLGYILNGHTNISNNKIIDFDLTDLLGGSLSRQHAVIFNIMTYVWNRISLRKDHILFDVDELSLLLDPNYPVIAKYLRDFSKRGRKYDAIVGVASQNTDDVKDPMIMHITKPLLANAAFKFLFHPDESGLEPLQKLLKLTDGEVDCISKPKQKYCLLKAGGEKYYMKVGELPYEKKLFGKLSG